MQSIQAFNEGKNPYSVVDFCENFNGNQKN